MDTRARRGLDFLAIRERSIERSQQWRLPDPGGLPLHTAEDFEWMRDARSVVQRCHAIAAALALTHRAPLENVRSAIEEHDLGPALAARERELLDILAGEIEPDEPSLQQLLVDIAWREEALLALLWTLGLADDLKPDEMCPRNEAVYERLAPELRPANTPNGLVLRPLPEIAAMLDFYYLLHWHARKAQYHGDVWDYAIAPGVVLERRRALEWLFQDAPWDDVDLAT